MKNMFTKESAIELYNEIASEKGRRLPQRGDIYRHFKGHLITVIDIAMHTEDETPLVIYHCHAGITTARPLDMFLEPVDKTKYPDIEQKYRLERVFDKSELDTRDFFEIFEQEKDIHYDMDPGEIKEYIIDRYYK